MQIGNILGSRKARQTMAAIVALGVVQIPLMSFAGAPAPWVQKADQKKKKKKAARRAARRPVQQTQTVTRAPEVPVETAYAPPPVEPAPAVVAEAPPVAPVPAPVTPPPVPVPAPVVASSGGFNWLFPVLGLVGLGGLVAALGNDSNG
ncbi:MAG: hypothetical protein WBL74_02730 [Novosphingobium sp.]|uniref:hypothetical protein n=1 Tax=Novosphingobium sp. TaxID=1874826 RepID=UPI003C7DA9EC